MKKQLTPKVVLDLARTFDSSLPKLLIDLGAAVFNDKVKNGRKYKFCYSPINNATWNFLTEKLPLEYPELRFKFTPYTDRIQVLHFYNK